MWNGTATKENTTVIPQKTILWFLKQLKMELPLIQQSHYWAYTQKNGKQSLEEIFG